VPDTQDGPRERGAVAPTRVVALDLMDTLVSDPYREALRAATGLDVGELFERRPAASWPAFERGELDEDAYWQGFRDVGIDFDPEAFHAARRAGTRLLPGMRTLLSDVRARVPVLVASNYPRWVHQVVADVLDGDVDGVVASCDVGTRKPEPAFYAHVLGAARSLTGTTPVEASAVLFVDDRETNVEAARAQGFDAVRFEGAAALRDALTVRGVLPG
jgi:FMN hydrolase / 5-amino-6-(5-phospho-D-ribitylamino)uracil phosphatase